MSFLSQDQRESALRQMDVYIDQLSADEKLLTDKLASVRNIKVTAKQSRLTVDKACNGELDIDSLITVDNVCRERLIYGISHCPVTVSLGDRQRIFGRYP